ncbi:MAG: AAA family ATPase, partial [Anaerolineae bacterium]|nr:AAA family ATPase [Anaerolineae bacterium]
MLTALRFENFKSWRVLDIALAPITLLFGTNSSGKSSVLQALLLLKQTLLSYDQAQAINLGGGHTDYVDFGSYADLIYGHDESQLLALSITFKTPVRGQVQSDMVYRAVWHLTDEIKRDDAFEPKPKNKSNLDLCLVELEATLDRIAYLAPLRAEAKRVYQS